MKYLKIKQLIILQMIVGMAFAQNPAPAAKQNQGIALINGKIFTVSGETIENGSVLFENGIITEIGKNLTPPTSYKVIDLKGKSVYPGLISPNSQLGILEIAAIKPSNDMSEIGKFNPNVRALIAYNTDSEIIPTVRGNGVLIGQTTPVGGVFSGTSSIMNFDGWNWEDAVLKADDGIWLNWPPLQKTEFNPSTFTREEKKNEDYSKNVDEIRTFLVDAKTYKELDKNAVQNAKMAALTGLFDGTKKLYVNANDDKQIIVAVMLASNLGINSLVIVGGENIDMSVGLLKEKQIPVILNSTHRVPNQLDDAVWEAYTLPKKLMDAGLLVGMYYNDSNWRSRNLGFVAGNAAAFGLSKADALKMVTLNNAKILGIDNLVGSIEKGKKATLIVTEGDVLDMKNAKVTQAFINGSEINLDDKQKRLNEKYKMKYGIND